MSRAFGSSKPTKNTGEYIHEKKATAIFCDKTNCFSSVSEQSSRDLLNLSMRLNRPAKLNYSNLNMNLDTKLVLTGVPVIKNNATGACPTSIDITTGTTHTEFIVDPANPANMIETQSTVVYNDDYRYTTYTIDPSGQLFNSCNNWKRYLVAEPL